MTAYTGTVTIPARAGERGIQTTGMGSYALTGALVNADTITWTDAVPLGTQAKIVGFRFFSVELDTNASPTMLFKVGDGTDDDGYLTSKGGGVGLQNSLAGQLAYFGDGAIIGTATQAGRNIVLTVSAAVATGATSGTLYYEVTVEGI